MTTAPTEVIGNAHLPAVRHADKTDLLRILNEQKAWRVDLVIPAEKLRFEGGLLQIEGQDPIVDADGVTDPNGSYWPTATFDGQVADKLGIGASYLHHLRVGRTEARTGKEIAVPRLDLWDGNVNGMLHGRRQRTRTVYVHDDKGEVIDTEQVVRQEALPADPRKFFVRLLRPDSGPGIARAFLSDAYGAPMDNWNGLMAMIAGIEAAGVNMDTLHITGDLSDNNMYIDVMAPEILVAAPELLEGYRSPFDTESEAVKRQGPAFDLERRIELGRKWREEGSRGWRNPHHMFEPGTEPILCAGSRCATARPGRAAGRSSPAW